MHRLAAITLAALVSVVAFKAIVGPGKIATGTAPTHKSFFGIHFAQPDPMKNFPAELPLP
jgi:hypothetical protein